MAAHRRGNLPDFGDGIQKGLGSVPRTIGLMFLRRRRSAEDFNEEIQAHIVLETARLMEDGLSPEDARAAAVRRFGNITRAQERFYEARRILWLDRLLQDLRCALRSMARHPLASGVAVISLAIGIGSTTAMLTLRDAVFFKPPPLYRSPEQLSVVQITTAEIGRGRVPGGLYKLWSWGAMEASGQRMPLSLYTGIAAAAAARAADIRTSNQRETVPVQAVTPELFSVLDVPAALGRTFSHADRETAIAPTAVLSHHIWQLFFDGSPSAIGRNIWIDGQPRTVIGVMPDRFWYSGMESPIWIPLDESALLPDELLEVVVRRYPHIAHAVLAEGLQRSVTEYAGRLPENKRQLRVLVSPMIGTPVSKSISPFVVLLMEGAVLLTLMIACTNVAILMMVQWTGREREIAIRASLGASRGRLMRLLLTESMILGGFGGALGICATFLLRGLIMRHGPAQVGLFDLTVDPAVLIQSAVATLLCGIMVGLAPALYETRRLEGNPLRALPVDRVRQRWRHTLAIMEVTLTMALLVVAGAMIDGYYRNMSFNMGFPTRALLTARVENPAGVQVTQILERLNSLPGIDRVAAATAVPLSAWGDIQEVATDAAGSNSTRGDRALISPDFFTTLGVSIRQGRPFTGADAAASEPVVIINETLRRRLLSNGDFVGKYLWSGNSAYQIVGVAADYADLPLGRPKARFYLPITQHLGAVKRVEFVVRTTGNPIAMVRNIRSAIRGDFPTHALSATHTLDSTIESAGREILSVVYPMALLIAIATLLTAAGIYSVLAFAVTLRSRELAVRVAIGATRVDVLRLVAFHSIRLVAFGLVLGTGATFALTRIAQGAGGVFDSPGWQAFVIPILIVVGVGALATWIPSRRALAINPAELLRTE